MTPAAGPATSRRARRPGLTPGPNRDRGRLITVIIVQAAEIRGRKKELRKNPQLLSYIFSYNCSNMPAAAPRAI